MKNTPSRNELTGRITARLGTHKYCTIFEKDLSRFFPYVEKEREKRFAAIKEYARRHGWHATVLDPVSASPFAHSTATLRRLSARRR